MRFSNIVKVSYNFFKLLQYVIIRSSVQDRRLTTIKPYNMKNIIRKGEIFFCPTIFCSHKYHKILKLLFLNRHKKIFLAKTLSIIVLFTQTFVIKLSKIWILDPGFGKKNLFRVLDPGSKRHRIPDPDPQHCLEGTR
jgi:hypothetical protein